MVLKTLDTMGPTHGGGIAQRIQQVSRDALHLNQGTLSIRPFCGCSNADGWERNGGYRTTIGGLATIR